ncbi:MAG: cupin [Pseudomonadota bacterium]
MAVNKLHHEFHKIDLDDLAGWQLPEGYAPDSGALEKIISGALDYENKRGSRTRLLRFPPGFATFKPIVHDYWEEVFMLQGDMTVGADENGQGGDSFEGTTYAVRPPGAWHGPFRSKHGCYLLESHYYDPA